MDLSKVWWTHSNGFIASFIDDTRHSTVKSMGTVMSGQTKTIWPVGVNGCWDKIKWSDLRREKNMFD